MRPDSISGPRQQSYAQYHPYTLHIGDAGDNADIVDAANKNRKISAKVSRVSGALDPRTRTMLVEVMLDNPDETLLSGSFAYMTLHVPEPTATQIPVGAMITRGSDQFIALVDQNSRLHLVKIQVAATDGVHEIAGTKSAVIA